MALHANDVTARSIAVIAPVPIGEMSPSDITAEGQRLAFIVVTVNVCIKILRITY
jgi:hypothetical protein